MSMHVNIQEGKKYGMLTAICKAPNRGMRVMWLFKCDECGNENAMQACRVVRGTIKSCRCTAGRNAGLKHFKHGQCKNPLYKVWNGMRERCANPKNKSYPNYGARGIRFSNEWKTFAGFFKDMGNGYQKGLYLDRIDNNKGYNKENCRWVDVVVSGQNRRNVKMTPEIIREVRTAKATAKQLAKRFNCGVATINDVRQNISWSNI